MPGLRTRIVKTKFDHELIDIRHGEEQLVLIGYGRNTYLWVRHPNGGISTFSGNAALRRLANAILREVGHE